MRAHRNAWLSLMPFLLMIVFSGCQRRLGEPDDADQLLRPQDVLSFDRLYNQNCSACHGVNGTGGPALDLANPVYQALVDDKSLEHWITAGVPGTQMPAFGESAGGFLTQQQVHALAAGMRRQWAASASVASNDMPSYLPTSVGDAGRGEQVYQTGCLSCHRGDKQKITDPAYLALMSDQSLRTIVIAGRPDLGHPDWKHVRADKPLAEQDVSDIVAYLHSLRSDTPGQPYPDQSVKR